jgi:hypothetical protein
VEQRRGDPTIDQRETLTRRPLRVETEPKRSRIERIVDKAHLRIESSLTDRDERCAIPGAATAEAVVPYELSDRRHALRSENDLVHIRLCVERVASRSRSFRCECPGGSTVDRTDAYPCRMSGACARARLMDAVEHGRRVPAVGEPPVCVPVCDIPTVGFAHPGSREPLTRVNEVLDDVGSGGWVNGRSGLVEAIVLDRVHGSAESGEVIVDALKARFGDRRRDQRFDAGGRRIRCRRACDPPCDRHLDRQVGDIVRYVLMDEGVGEPGEFGRTGLCDHLGLGAITDDLERLLDEFG